MVDRERIDLRVDLDTRSEFYDLYDRWRIGKDKKDMDAFVRYLVAEGKHGLTSAGVRSFKP